MHLRSFQLSRRGFTLIELLVVIAVILIAVIAILPAFGRLIESQNYASSVNAVTATLGAARSRAIERSNRVGVMFLWDAKEERFSLQLIEQNRGQEGGSLTDQVSRWPANAEVYFPVTGSAPVELPRGIGVFGLSSAMPTGLTMANQPLTTRAGSATADTWAWYAGDVINGGNSDPADDIYLWLFPRNDPRLFTADEGNRRIIGADPWPILRSQPSSREALEAVRNVTTFFIVFAPDGSIVTSKRSGSTEYYDAFLELPNAPIDTADPTAAPYDDPSRFDPENHGIPTVPADRRAPNPEVMLRSADQLAIVDLARLSEGVGVPRAWLIRPQTSRAPQPQYLRDLGYFTDARARSVSRWIDLNAEVISFNRYSGNIVRRTSP